jgi:hypothetical protein
LFDEGRKIIRALLRSQRENVVLLSWFMENRDNVVITFGESIETLLTDCFGFNDVADAYRKVGEYFLASGWGDRARGILALGARLKNKQNATEESRASLIAEKN